MDVRGEDDTGTNNRAVRQVHPLAYPGVGVNHVRRNEARLEPGLREASAVGGLSDTHHIGRRGESIGEGSDGSTGDDTVAQKGGLDKELDPRVASPLSEGGNL